MHSSSIIPHKLTRYFCTLHKTLPPIETMATPISLQFTSTHVPPILSLMGVCKNSKTHNINVYKLWPVWLVRSLYYLLYALLSYQNNVLACVTPTTSITFLYNLYSVITKLNVLLTLILLVRERKHLPRMDSQHNIIVRTVYCMIHVYRLIILQ